MLDRTIPPKVHDIGNLELPKPVVETLPNGVELYMIDGGPQPLNRLSVVFAGGRIESGNEAVAHLMADMLVHGAADMSGAEISEALDFCGARFKASATHHHSVTNLSTLNVRSLRPLCVMQAILTEPTFPADAFARERDAAVKGLLQKRAKVAYLSMEALAKLIYGPAHPEARQPSVSEIEGVTTDDLRNLHTRVMCASGTKAILAGQLTSEIIDNAKTVLLALPAAADPMAIDAPPFMPQAPDEIIVDKPGSLQAAVSIGIPAPPRKHPDYVPLRAAVIALGGYFGSRLMANIREDKGYTYGIHSYLAGSQSGSNIIIAAQADNRYVRPLISEICAEMQALASTPMPADELRRVRQALAASLMETLDSPFSLSEYFISAITVGIPDGYFAQQVQAAQSISAETIMKMAAKYFNPQEMRIAIVGDKKLFG